MMPSSLIRNAAAWFLGVITLIAVLSCSKTEIARTQPPELLPDSTVSQIRTLINLGYSQLDSAKLQEAVSSFAEVSRLIPNGRVGEYHTACAYSRTGNKDQAFDYLTRVLDSGFDKPEQLSNDEDLEGLKDDPRFEPLLARALENFSKSSAVLSAGMPEYETAPVHFATEEEFNTWVDEQTRPFRAQYRFWRAGDALLAQIDFTARRLACLRELKKDDTTFDYGLERVRGLVRLNSPFEWGWGVVSDLVVREADAYIQHNPTSAGRSEADFQASFALSHKYSGQSDQRIEGFRQAEERLARVAEGTQFYGAALALKATNKLRTPGVDTKATGQVLKSIIEQFPGDDKLYRIVSTQTQNEAARYLWPLQLDQADLKNKMVSLDSYKGKALLIDFWATWCPPCRAELPNMVEVYKEYHPKGLEIVSISLDYADDTPTETYQKWIDSAGMTWRHIYDGEGWNTALVKRFFVGSIPAPFLVGKDGSLVAWGEDLHGESLAASVKTALGI
jgi:thiol-disulfide isomerase/thioredoxin